MADLFSVDFEDQKFISDIGTLGNHVKCSGGTIEISPAAALVGNYGMAVTPIRITSLGNYRGHVYLCRYIKPQTRLRQRFYFDPNSLDMTDYQRIAIAQGEDFSNFPYKIHLYSGVGTYIIEMRTMSDARVETDKTYLISDATHYIEFDWKASSAPGANDGFGYTWIDGTLRLSTTGIDNDTFTVSTPKLGMCLGTTSAVNGTIYFDNWRANNDGSLIGA